jgi:uncharacterized membrane protein YkoI
MSKRIITTVSTIAVTATIGIAGVAAASTKGDDTEQPITGAALIRATEAALAHTGEGQVTDTEVGDEDSYYEVEVTFDDGRQVDVQLDEHFRVVVATADAEGEAGDQ